MPFDNKPSMRSAYPWGSNVKATRLYRQHVTDMQTSGRKPLNPDNWWNANRTAVAKGS